MLNILLTVLSVLLAAFKRLRANIGLALCALAALLAAVALAVSIPVYAEGASLRLLQNTLATQEQQTNRSAFALLFRYYVGGANQAIEWERARSADDFLSGPGLERLGLPLQGLARHARTGQLRLFLPPSSASTQGSAAGSAFLKDVTLGFMSGMDDQIRIVDGTAPRPATSVTAPVDVMIMRELAGQIGINVGDEFSLVTNSSGQAIPIRVTALWEPNNAADPAWFFEPGAFRDVILVPEATWTGPVAAQLTGEVNQILWFARLSGTNLTAAEASPLLGRIQSVRAQAAGLLAGLKLEQSPAEALTRYRAGAAELTAQLFVFSMPILALVLYFAGLVAALLVQRQRGEIALLKTRGVRDAQILGIYLIEWLILGMLALTIGPTLGLLFATFMGRTQSFLQLAADVPPLNLGLTWASIGYGMGAVALALVAALVPALVAARRTLVDEQQQTARALRPPLWQRLYLDVLLLIPPAYGIYQLRRSGGLQLGTSSSADPFSNPLLLLVPVLLCFALGLLAVRLIPLLLELLARMAARPSWVAPLIALRALARQPGAYRGPLLLLILTLSLAAFSASMAATLDGSLHQAIGYQVGAPTQLLETGQSTEEPQDESEEAEQTNIAEAARWLFVPVNDHLEIPGIVAATRVGSYGATIQQGGVNQTAQLVGIDRSDFPKVVSSFDPAWAGGQSLGALMNLLAQTPQGVLVSQDALAKGLKVGDTLPAVVEIAGDRREMRFTIVAAVDLWPGYYPNTQAGPILVANLDYIFDQMSGQYPYDVWIARDPAADLDALVAGLRGRGITIISVIDAATLIKEAQAQPKRQGLFGLLSVGFIAAGALTLLGFLLAALITARRRAIELGVLRALGLAAHQVAVALTIEQVLLVAAGIGAGTGIGLLAATLVVPLMQVGVGPQPGTPPYPPQIAWDQVTVIYIVFAVALLLTLLALVGILGRMRLFQAVKLGDTN